VALARDIRQPEPIKNINRFLSATSRDHNIQLRGFAPIMDTVLSFLISAGIVAFGVWIVAGTIAAGSPLGWTLIGLLPVIVGSISLYKAIRDAKARRY
jgi:hypothetical protein